MFNLACVRTQLWLSVQTQLGQYTVDLRMIRLRRRLRLFLIDVERVNTRYRKQSPVD